MNDEELKKARDSQLRFDKMVKKLVEEDLNILQKLAETDHHGERAWSTVGHDQV